MYETFLLLQGFYLLAYSYYTNVLSSYFALLWLSRYFQFKCLLWTDFVLDIAIYIIHMQSKKQNPNSLTLFRLGGHKYYKVFVWGGGRAVLTAIVNRYFKASGLIFLLCLLIYRQKWWHILVAVHVLNWKFDQLTKVWVGKSIVRFGTGQVLRKYT